MGEVISDFLEKDLIFFSHDYSLTFANITQ